MGQLASQLFHGQVCVIPSLSQLQWADKRSRVHFKCAICIWNLLLSTVKMRSKSCHYQWSKPSLGWKKQNKPIREIAKTLGVAKTTVWNILKRRNAPVSSATPKDPEDHGKQLWWMTEEFFPWWRKHPSQQLARSRTLSRRLGVCVSKSTIKRRLHQSEYRGFTTRCKPLVSLKNRKARLEFAKRHLKKPSQFWNNILWTDETKINLYQSDGKRRVWRRKGTAHDPKHTTSSVKHGGGSVMAWACMAASGTGSLVFIDAVTADKSSRMNSEVFSGNYLLIFSQMLQNSLDGASQCRWTMTQSILQKQPKSFWRERSGLLCNGQVNHLTLNPIEHAFHLLKTKLKGKCPKNKQELKTVAVEAWQSITRDETQHLVMSMRSRLQAVIDCKGFATKY